ncbi:YusW family protein [Enterococcus wangshanyuanii]|uniref:Uncharacterized protein n=1 Tax=Enterococcus wangshanyuanii TaxID=2005703 RepID=A0ABQ1NH19_9ENTE|nr:YusW family protein [Enterococcus wangshanyuanii]GGC77017.1 hypothetical protein GCM10011573_03320 [Enterococcus wangshanyuanii]
MKMTNITKSLLVAGVALSISAAPFISGVSAEASTVISETAYEKIISFTKADLDKAVGTSLTASTINKVYTSLSQAKVWEKLGYSKADAKKVAARFSESKYQATGILTEIAMNEHVSLKVVTINKPYYSSVNIGTMGESTAPGTDESSTEESTTEETTPSEDNNAAAKQSMKEIDVDIEYKNKDIELEYDVKSDGTVKAKFENEFTGEKMSGVRAQQKIEAIFAGLDVRNSSQTQIKNHVITKLNANQNFKKFDFKVKFVDKTKVDFKIK